MSWIEGVFLYSFRCAFSLHVHVYKYSSILVEMFSNKLIHYVNVDLLFIYYGGIDGVNMV